MILTFLPEFAKIKAILKSRKLATASSSSGSLTSRSFFPPSSVVQPPMAISVSSGDALTKTDTSVQSVSDVPLPTVGQRMK